jgi:competence protein ComEC
MAEPERSRRRAQGGRAETWRPWVPPWAASAGPSWAWPDGLANLARRAAHRIREWLAVEVGAGRLVPWLAIAFGCGIIVYFSIDQEPAPWAAAILLAAMVAATVCLRNRPLGFPMALGIAAIASGFAAATIKCAIIAHPVLSASVWNVDIAGFVETREARERSDRITLRVERIAGPRVGERLERVRLSLRKGTAPAVGNFVELKARLSPPLAPLRPGGYDFARDMYFARIGASGWVLGRIHSAQPPHAPAFALRYAMVIDGMRQAIDKRMHAVLPGDKGSIASALITGTRDAISTPLNEAMYISGLGHVLSISGYHMAVVAGIMFFAMRALFALLGAFANRHPIKKWAALAALAVAGFYLLLSGAEVATQRSFIMIAIVLIGVMVDRQTLTFRTLTVAALGVLLLAPEAVVHPSFQMSFAATLALIAGYQQGLPWMSKGGETPLAARIALWGGREIVSLTLVSLLAGTATIPYTAYHFHRISPYGVIANLVAMPVVSAWVMPWGILGLLAMPFGLDDTCWWLMGLGIDWMIAVALWVTTFPGALGRMAAFGAAPLIVCTLGLVILCLLKTPLRFIGSLLIGAAVVMMIRAPQPDVLIAADASAAAVRGRDGRLAMVNSGGDVFALREWLAADGDARSPKDSTLGNGIACDEAGCVGMLRDGSLVAIVKRADAFEEDCRRALLVISAREAPPDCAALTIDRRGWRAAGARSAGARSAGARSAGAMALRRTEGRFEIETTYPSGYDRPWAHSPARNLSDLAVRSESNRSTNPQPRDATPNADDLEAGD